MVCISREYDGAMATLTDLQTRLAEYRAVEAQIRQNGQEYEISSGPDGSRFRRPDLREVRQAIVDLEIQIEQVTARTQGRSRVRVGVPNW